MTKCPDCNGDGSVKALACGKSNLIPLEIDCELCGKTGQIDAEKSSWRVAGARLKEDRIRRGFTLRREAFRREIDPVELSKMERGILKPVRG